MPKKKLQPVIYKDSWHAKAAKELYETLKKSIFEPLLKSLEEANTNAKVTALERALRDGTIQYEHGRFRGKRSAAISKEIKELGGRFRGGTWILPVPMLTTSLKKAIDLNKKAMKQLATQLNQKFDTMMADTAALIQNITDLDEMNLVGIRNVSEEVKRSIHKELAVQPKLNPDAMERLKQGYLVTDQLPIKLALAQKGEIRMKGAVIDFSQEVVEDLRTKLNDAIGSGRPRQEVRDIIMGKLHISKERCKFIARQETALMTTKFKAAQYTEFGMDTYEWRTVRDKNVRHTHQMLDRTIQDWNNPPVVDEKTQRRAQAGEDYNCRCQAVPVVEW